MVPVCGVPTLQAFPVTSRAMEAEKAFDLVVLAAQASQIRVVHYRRLN